LETKESIILGQSALTIPQSPAIQKPKPKIEHQPPSPAMIKANPVPDFSHAFVPAIEHRKIVPSDFKLPGDSIQEKKHEEFLQKKAKAVDEMEKAKLFKANPIAIPEKVFSIDTYESHLQLHILER
jgi:hypothetical protein